MRGQMMDRPLLVSLLIEYAGRYHGDTEIVTRAVEGGIRRSSYAAVERRACQLANAFARLGVAPGDRVATLAWNTDRHIELYYAISSMGAVCHTINPRLFREQIRYIVNHAADKIVCLDLSFVPLAESLADELVPVRHYVIMSDRVHMPATPLAGALCYEELIAAETTDFAWPSLDENTAAALCYTSGTTGNPKGALFSHRSTVLHAFSVCAAGLIGLSMDDTVLPVVPQFHVNAWGVPYAAAMCGAKLVLPGAALDGASLYELFEAEQVTVSLGVPTVWLALLQHLEANKLKFSSLQRTVIGGSAVPPAMIRSFEETYGVRVIHAWGMTEISPIGTANTLKKKLAALPPDERFAVQTKQGRAVFGVDLKLVDAAGAEQPHDGVARGELLVRGPWVIDGYYKDAEASLAVFDEAGWFRTGDVATIDDDGYLQIVDRIKDVVKSGGEWISSIDVENAAIGHPDIAEAAVIAVPHPRWGERPLLVVVGRQGRVPDKASVLQYLAGLLAKWQLPDDVVVVAELPHTATGKLLKTQLREMFRNYPLPEA
ncbi:MAG: long-chain-fatty-acid--CoA ligase [Rhodospirillales bacterium]|nr:long-chain-fatty-acid--CoA ligase [Rhodospirillales bacterium]